MSVVDWSVLVLTIVLVVLYGVYKGRTTKDIDGYFRSSKQLRWYMVMLSVIGTQASAVTFLSANAFTVCASFAGDRNEIVIAPDFNCPIASFSNGRTVATTSAVLMADLPATVAPAALYSSSW